MGRFFLFLITLCVLSSCTTIVHEATYPMKFTTNLPEASIIYNEVEYQDSAIVEVKRSKSPLHVLVQNDSISKDFEIKSKISGLYWFGNLFLTPWGVGYLVDLTNQKRYTYGNAYHFQYSDTGFIAVRKKIDPVPLQKHIPRPIVTEKGQFNLIFPLISYTNMYFHPQGEPNKSHSSLLRISGGFEYFYSDRKSIQLKADANFASST